MQQMRSVAVGLLLLSVTAAEIRSQGCDSTSFAVATPTINPNRKPLRLAAASSNQIGAVHVEFGTNNYYFGRYTSALSPIGPQVELLRRDRPIEVVALVFTGTEYGFFFNQATDPRVRFMRIAVDGTVLTQPALVLNEAFTETRQSYDVKWDGFEYVIARTDLSSHGRGVWINRLTREGKVVANERLSGLVSAETTVFLELIGTLPVVVWNASPEPELPETNLAVFVSPTNQVFQLRDVPIAGRIASTAVEGDRLILVSNGIGATGPKITYAVFGRDGTVVTRETDLIVSEPGEKFSVQSLLAGSGEIALAYSRVVESDFELREYRLRRMRPDFTLISDLPFNPDPARRYYLPDGEPVRTSNAYIHSVSRYTASGFDANLISQCPYIVRLLTPRVEGRILEPVQFSVEASGGIQPYTVRWDFGDRFFGLGNPVTHAYLSPGTYEVKATVTDATGVVLELAGVAIIGPAVISPPPGRRRLVRR